MPDEGAPATERTEAWVMFDGASIYVGARVWDTAPPSQWVANEMRRDTSQLRDNDGFWVVFDTFLDRRNGVVFYTNPLGAIGDFQITNEGNPNSDWNPVWDVRTGRFDGGWTVEMEIPFQSLRVPARRRAGLGGAAPAEHPAQERVGVSDAASDRRGAACDVSPVPGGHAGGPGGSGCRYQSRGQALRHRGADDEPRRQSRPPGTSETAMAASTSRWASPGT